MPDASPHADEPLQEGHTRFELELVVPTVRRGFPILHVMYLLLLYNSSSSH